MEPLACSLDPGTLAARERWAADLAGHALAVTPTPAGVVARFPAALEAEVRALAEAEEACCPFLELRVAHVDGAVELAVTGPPEARPIVERLFVVRDGD